MKSIRKSNKRHYAAFVVAALYLALCVLFVTHSRTASAKTPASGIAIVKITVGEDRIDTGRNQLIEVLMKNVTRKTITGKVSLSIVLPNHNIIKFKLKRN